MNDRPDVDQLLRQMQSVRQRLDADARAAKKSVHDMTDWRRLVGRAPVASMTAALALGYFLVPKRVEKPQVTAKDLKKIRKREPVVINKDDDDASDTLLGAAIAIGGAALMRAAATYLAGRIGRVFSK